MKISKKSAYTIGSVAAAVAAAGIIFSVINSGADNPATPSDAFPASPTDAVEVIALAATSTDAVSIASTTAPQTVPTTAPETTTVPVTTKLFTTVPPTTVKLVPAGPAVTAKRTTRPSTTVPVESTTDQKNIGDVAAAVLRIAFRVKKDDTTTAPAADSAVPAAAKVQNVPYINQHQLGYPMGCEAASGTMLLKFYGYDVSMADVVAAIPSGKGKYKVGDTWYAADPFEEFVGDPRNTSSEGAYGCFAKPLAVGMSKFAGERVTDISGCTVEELFLHVSQGRPVVVWGASNEATLSNGVSWQCVDKNGKLTGKYFQEIKREHCMVLVGYDEQYVYLNDPSHNSYRAQDKKQFISNWTKLYSQAIIIV